MNDYPPRSAKELSRKKRKRHSTELIFKKLRDTDAMVASGMSVGEVRLKKIIGIGPWVSRCGKGESQLANLERSCLCRHPNQIFGSCARTQHEVDFRRKL
jgi:hypothetical protein